MPAVRAARIADRRSCSSTGRPGGALVGVRAAELNFPDLLMLADIQLVVVRQHDEWGLRHGSVDARCRLGGGSGRGWLLRGLRVRGRLTHGLPCAAFGGRGEAPATGWSCWAWRA